MNFSQALELAKVGHKVTRDGWNGRGMCVFVTYPVAPTQVTVPFLVLMATDGELVPWAPSQADLFAEDWSVCS